MAAVADTSPLILLAKISRLTLLPELYGDVFVPPGVAMELRAKPDATSPELDRFMRSAHIQPPGNLVQVRRL
jgi:predicted nucleic acid-binding protein